MGSLIIRKIRADEFWDFTNILFFYTDLVIDEQFINGRKSQSDFNYLYAAFIADRMVGTLGARVVEVKLFEKNLETLAVGQASILPQFTRKGIMSKLVKYLLNCARNEGFPFVVWTTSEWPLYTKMGNGIATYSAEYELNKLENKILKEIIDNNYQYSVSYLDTQQKAEKFAEIEKAAFEKGYLYMYRNYEFWHAIIFNANLYSEGKDGRSNTLLIEDDEGEKGIAHYTIREKWVGELYDTELDIEYFFHTSTRVAALLINELFKIGLIKKIVFRNRPRVDYLRHILLDGRRYIQRNLSDRMWVRNLDHEFALEKIFFEGGDKQFLGDRLMIRITNEILDTTPHDYILIIQEETILSTVFGEELEEELDFISVNLLSSLLFNMIPAVELLLIYNSKYNRVSEKVFNFLKSRSSAYLHRYNLNKF